jgi:hypothetical protein
MKHIQTLRIVAIAIPLIYLIYLLVLGFGRNFNYDSSYLVKFLPIVLVATAWAYRKLFVKADKF